MKALVKSQYISLFKAAFLAGIEHIVRAAEIYVKAIDEDPTIKDKFEEEFADTIPVVAWSSFEAVGRKWLHPKLLLGGGGKYAAAIKRLPYSDQEKIFSGKKCDLLTEAGTVVKVDVREITSKQAEQLFDKTRIRPVTAQKAFIEARKLEPEKDTASSLPYQIIGEKVYFRRGVVMTKHELAQILKGM